MLGGRKAFTLVEVLVATAIAALVVTTMSLIFRQGLATWEKGDRRLVMNQSARTAVDMITRELKATLVSKGNRCLIFRGEESHLTFAFVSSSRDASGEYDVRECTYYLDDDCLMKTLKADLDCRTGEGGSTATVVSDVVRLAFGYYDGRQWNGSWDSSMHTPKDTSDDIIPEAVRVSVWNQDSRGLEMPLVTSSMVSMRMDE